jgi:hypothetical protein
MTPSRLETLSASNNRVEAELGDQLRQRAGKETAAGTMIYPPLQLGGRLLALVGLSLVGVAEPHLVPGKRLGAKVMALHKSLGLG